MSLKDDFIARIRTDGPITVASFMAEALLHPSKGYYPTRDPLGAAGDFITAPEISSLFGELIGLWCVQAWIDLGSPAHFNLIELGPGKGTLMRDMLRAARIRPDFNRAAQVYLIEASAALQAEQARTLGTVHDAVHWVRDLEAAGDGPSLIVANEFLDCLPIRQFVRHQGRWHERRIGLDETGDELAFVLGPRLSELDLGLIPPSLAGLGDGALVEVSPGVTQWMETIAQHFDRRPGHALLVDYGPMESEAGDTLQALKQHTKVSPLSDPGTADLTARVDFAAARDAAATLGLRVGGPITQSDFLLGLGIEHRALALIAKNPEAKKTLARQIHRLTDTGEMGELFKVMMLSAPSGPLAPGMQAKGKAPR